MSPRPHAPRSTPLSPKDLAVLLGAAAIFVAAIGIDQLIGGSIILGTVYLLYGLFAGMYAVHRWRKHDPGSG